MSRNKTAVLKNIHNPTDILIDGMEYQTTSSVYDKNKRVIKGRREIRVGRWNDHEWYWFPADTLVSVIAPRPVG